MTGVQTCALPISQVTPGEVNELEQSWRHVLLAALPLSLLALALGWFLEKKAGYLSPFDTLVYPLTSVFSVLAWGILAIYKKSLRWTILSLILGSSLFFIAKLIYILFALPPEFLTYRELADGFYWTPIIYLMCFLVSGVRGGGRLATHFTLAYFWVSLLYLLFHKFQAIDTTLNTLSMLVQVNLSHFVQLILSFSFMSLKKRYSHSQSQIEALDQSIHTDFLTGLPNRLNLQKTLETALQEAQQKGTRVAVFFIDIDRFKLINDTLGHQSGDKILELVAKRLGSAIRDGDFVARISGDEFIVIAKDIDKPNLIPFVAQRLLDTFVKPFEVFGQMLTVSTSVGSSLFPDDAYDAEMLIRNADSAMYAVKKRGKNGFMTYHETDSGLERRWQLEKDLKIALEQEQFSLYYQPMYNLNTGEMTKLEALIRWNHPDHGLVSPSEFISVAEESGQILSLGTWVLEEACRQGKAWNIQGRFKMSVNVSMLQFAHPNFLITVMNALKESGLPGYCLELELTESIVMGHPEDVKRTLLDLKDLGIHLAIDDFGTGYSSLAYLRDLPINTIKIDKSFIQDLDTQTGAEPFSKALVETITGLAKRLNLEVVAEGVETETQCVILRQLGCHVGQGYYFSKPIASENVEPILGKMMSRPTLMALHVN